jgi:hypothetical protein
MSVSGDLFSRPGEIGPESLAVSAPDCRKLKVCQGLATGWPLRFVLSSRAREAMFRVVSGSGPMTKAPHPQEIEVNQE